MEKSSGFLKALAYLTLIFFPLYELSWSATTRYAERFCTEPEYFCIKTHPKDTWESLFPTDEAIDLVKRVNRMNIRLKSGLTLAIPKNLDQLTIYDIAPFPKTLPEINEKTIFVSQQKLAWAAYDENGELIWWGPISSGSKSCPNGYGGCSTPTGEYRIIRKQDRDCISTAFPQREDGDNGGAEMPYCMHFFRGYALHGSEEVPGFRASHGCVRLFTEDARWLNEEFVDLPGSGVKGTRVIIEEL